MHRVCFLAGLFVECVCVSFLHQEPEETFPQKCWIALKNKKQTPEKEPKTAETLYAQGIEKGLPFLLLSPIVTTHLSLFFLSIFLRFLLHHHHHLWRGNTKRQ